MKKGRLAPDRPLTPALSQRERGSRNACGVYFHGNPQPAWRKEQSPVRGGTQSGVTLIEALVTLLVVTVGLLGVAALQVIGIQEGSSAFQHSQATWLAYDMADRMRANLDADNPLDADDRGAMPGGDTNPYDGISVSTASVPTGQACGANDACTQQQMADFDADQWRLGIIALPNGSGTVIADPALVGRYRIRVMWDEVRAGSRARETGCPSDPGVPQACVELWVQP